MTPKHRGETKGHSRVAPVCKRILRMGIPTQRGREGGREEGASPYIIRTRSTSQTRAMMNDPDISPAPAHHAKPRSENLLL